jgi:KAP family P-loop domain
VLDEFITERLGSDDYRSRLGVPALVRRDLERLSQLVLRQDMADGAPTSADHPIHRIVLYIDDLDRCPTTVVVKVLQAVHLLLAFPLFVVVVAVDARWLASSLEEHYRQLGGGGATPGDYLEKIFQVPFWVRDLPVPVRQRMLRGLLAASLVPADGTCTRTGEDEEDLAGPMSEAGRAEFTDLVASLSTTEELSRPWRQVSMLTISREELAAIEDVAPLLAPTPRSVKRFANIYLLLKAMSRSRAPAAADHERAILLLAITSGLPALATHLFAAIERVSGVPLTLGDALGDLPADDALLHQRERLDAWLAQRPNRKDTALSGPHPSLDVIRRFSFSLDHGR